MKVDDFGGVHTIATAAELERLMRVRFSNDLNEFLLSHESSGYPLLAIFAKRDLAAIYYIPKDGDAGFASVGKDTGLPPDGTTTFLTGGNLGQELEVTNRAILPFSVALRVALEFLRDKQRPRSIEWLQL